MTPRGVLFRRRLVRASAPVVLVSLALACGPTGSSDAPAPGFEPAPAGDRAPLVLVGIDGGEWKIIRRLWAEGGLPNLRRLADTGAAGTLKTAYVASPVIWTTIATGRTAEEHGIVDFVVPTGQGTVPVSSAVRRVPALWNMASRAGLRTAVVGWWASWPAEPIEGVVISDRAHLALDRIVHPESRLTEVRREQERALQRYPDLGGRLPGADRWMADAAKRDRLVAHEARRLAGEGFDLLLVYYRSVDVASHRYWKYIEPERYEGLPGDEIAARSHVIPTVYEAVDEAIGDLLAACPEGSNVFVISDHGFVGGSERPFVIFSIDRMLEEMGFLVREAGKVDFARSIAYPFASPDHALLKKIRLSVAGREANGRLSREEVPRELDRLARELEAVRYEDGGPVFRVLRSDLPPGTDLAAEVIMTAPSLRIRVGSRILDDVVLYINRISGVHNDDVDGILIASGPDLAAGASVEGISVFDIAPTLLYALGLPVGEDFAGHARTELFSDSFRSRHPLRTVPTWGTKGPGHAEPSPLDDELLEQLRALGYL